jgi:transcriptional antiterminator RfaH
MEHLQRDWYVVYSNPHKEEQARFHLGLKGVEAFFPRLSLPVAHENKKRIIPLFPNYIFVRVHMPNESHLIIWTPGIKKIVSFGDEPIPIDDGIVEFLQQQADANGVIEARSKLRQGQEVEISGGPFDGLMGIIQSPPDGQGRVRVLLKLLSRQVSVNFGVGFIRGGESAWAPAVVGDIGTGLKSAAG